MTDSVVKPRSGKRARLVASAMDLLHRQGLHKPTLAEIAVAADVPPGNVYYYFKSRDDLVRAVVGTRIDQQRAMFTELEAAPEPRARLQGALQIWVDEREMLTAYGCPLAGLHTDLHKIGGDLADESAKLIEMRIDWIGTQFGLMGCTDGRRLAITMIGCLQGVSVVAQALRDPEIITAEVARLGEWIDSMVREAV